MRYLFIWMLVSECGGKGEGGVGYKTLNIYSLCIAFYIL